MSIEVITNNNYSSELDFGIDRTDQTVHFIENQILENDYIQNPFYIGFNGGNLVKHGVKKVYEFETVIVLINNGLSSEFMSNFFSAKLKQSDLNNFTRTINNSIKFIRVSRNILFNKMHIFKANIVKDSDLKILFPNETFNPVEIILPLFELTSDEVKTYCNLYKTSTNIEDLKQTFQLNMQFNKTNTLVKDALSKLISELKESDFWTKTRNCKLNFTNMFNVRDYQSRTDNNKFTLMVQTTDKEKLAMPDGSSNYPVQNVNDKFFDVATILKNNHDGNRTFYATIPDSHYTEKDFMDLLKTIKTEKELYELTTNILISKEYCHLIMKAEPLSFLATLFEKYSGAYKYSFGYAFLTLYLEESIFLTKSTKNNRYVFDIFSANKLPVFPFLQTDLKQNPYISPLIHNDHGDFQNNMVGLKYIDNYDGYGICNLDTFKKRLNIFITGEADKDILEGINMENYALSGSIIPACLPKRSPLYDSYLNEFKDETVAFKNFIQNYYSSSDIDIMCNLPNYYDFITNAYDVYKSIMNNSNSTNNDSSYDTVRTIGVSLSKQFFRETLDDFNKRFGVKWTTTQYEENVKDNRVKLYIHSKYYYIKNRLNEALYQKYGFITNEFLLLFMKPLSIDNLTIYILQDEEYDMGAKKKDTDFVFYVNDFRTEEDKVKDYQNKALMKIGESIRFKLQFKKLNRTFELFKASGSDFFSTVARFHLPCVRAYYTNSNVYILPSCIGAMMTGMNIDYKYFAGIRDPNDILVKYMKRGFGTILNKGEIKQLKEFLTKNNITQNYLGPKEVYSDIFTQFDSKKEYKYISNYDELKNKYKKTNKVINCLKFNNVSENGNINKCIKSFFDLYYDSIN
jgi:hypothetical protein